MSNRRSYVGIARQLIQGIGLVRSRYWLSSNGVRLDAGPFVVALEYATGRKAMIFGKPEPAIFETVLCTMGLRAESVAMIGDDPISDAAAAAAVGMRTVLVCTGKYRQGSPDPSESASDDHCKADVVVHSVVVLIPSG